MTVIVPTFNEAENIRPLLHRLDAALVGFRAAVLFVDDPIDGTSGQIRAVADEVRVPVDVLHRPSPVDGLGGAPCSGWQQRGVPGAW